MPGHSTSTVRRRLDSISSVFNTGRLEFDIQCLNPFERLTIPSEGIDVEKRDPFTFLELQSIASACHKADDDIRHIIALQLATGARLGEIVGLRREDVSLDPPVQLGKIGSSATIRQRLTSSNLVVSVVSA